MNLDVINSWKTLIFLEILKPLMSRVYTLFISYALIRLQGEIVFSRGMYWQGAVI